MGASRSHEGSGPGLVLMKGLVGLIGGSVAVESAVGRESVFTVALPRAEAEVQRAVRP